MDRELPSLTAVVTLFPAPSQTFVRRKLVGLRDRGMSVQVAAAMFSETAERTGFPYLCLMPWRTPRTATSRASRAAWTATAGAVLRTSDRSRSGLRDAVSLAPILAVDTDVVHFEFSGIAASYLELLPTLARRSHIAVSCRGAAEQIEPLKDPSRRELLGRVFEHASLIHCVSDDMRRTVEAMGAPPERILVNRPAVPVQEFASLRRPRGEHAGALRVLSIGRLHWKKGFDDGLRAMAELRRRGIPVDYRIAGEGSEREKLEFLTHELDLSSSARLLGAVDQSEVRELLGWADALLLPSLSEGISNVVLEAMAAGVPVVSTDCGGMAEVVEDGVNGHLLHVGDTTTMADHLAALAADPDHGARLARRAAQDADERLDLRFQIDRFVAAYAALGPR